MTKLAFRALAALLSYPDEALVDALPELESAVPKAASPLIQELKQRDLLLLQERYVSLFDRSRALSLHLFEHVHGESGDRGQAMVDLQAMYAARGLGVMDHELPDYLPAFLEFLSVVEKREATKLLGEVADILRALGNRLAERGSPYACLFACLLELGAQKGLDRHLSPEKTPEIDRAALDAQWMDPEVSFGGPQPVRFYRKGIAA